jgi:twitching motility protein PilT
MDYKKELEDLVLMIQNDNVSDLHFSEGRVPIVRSSGFLIPVLKKKPLTKNDIEGFTDYFLSSKQKEKLKDERQVDFSFDYSNEIRFRGNIFFQLGKLSIALRFIPKNILNIEQLNLPPILETFATKKQGFFLVVGPSGQGKSTTLAALIENINQNRLEHIVTIEDPVEYIFESKKAIIDQREIREDSPDFKTALTGVFRQDIDILMVGEMREPETISTAVTAAETGHLVFSTLHTNTASQTIARIIDSFPSGQQEQIRIQLAGSLLGIFSQRHYYHKPAN